jgi:hypothetical protein
MIITCSGYNGHKLISSASHHWETLNIICYAN